MTQPSETSNQNIALVTGASRGIGRACSRELAKAGWKVMATARSADDLASLSSEYPGIETRSLDLCSEAGRSSLADWLERVNLSSVVHCLGGRTHSSNKVNIWQDHMNLNFLSVVAINEIILPSMIKRSQGTIVHISSSAASHGYAFTPYACAKSALNRYIINTGRKHMKSGVSIMGIMPTAVEGDNNQWEKAKRDNPASYQEKSQEQALGRLQTTDEIAKVVSWLCTSESKIFAGCVLPADSKA